MKLLYTKTKQSCMQYRSGVLFLLASLLIVCVLASCAPQETKAGGEEAAPATDVAGSELQAASYGMDFEFTDREKNASYDEASATKIMLSNSGSTIEGTGASVDGSVVTINEEGTYIVSGSLQNGSVCVNAPDDQKVQIVLNGATIHNETGAALLVEEADKVFVTLAEGATNVLSDGSSHATSEDGSDHDGVVFSHSDIAFNGEGALEIEATYKAGIVSKDDLVITSGSYTVNAVGDALQGKDCVKILDGSFDLTAGSDGIQSNNTEDATRGFVSIDGGTFKIASYNDGVQAKTVLRIFGGEFDIVCGDGATGEIVSGQEFMGRNMMGQQAETSSESASATESVKGLKAGQLVEVDAANITVSSIDDAIHSNGSVSIIGGTLNLTSDDDAVHADNITNVEGGVIDVAKCNEGLEGGKVYVKGGEISIVAVDDGLNAASDVISDYDLRIEGGTLYVEAAADALDSNGSINVTGGTTVVYSTNSGIETALDVDMGTANISGGALIAGGPSGQMASVFSSESDQPSFMYQAESTLKEGTVLSVVSGNNAVLMTFEVKKASPSVIISCPELEVGQTYTIYEGASLGSQAVNGLELGGQLGSATQLTEFTLSENSALVTADGQVSAAAQGGMGAMGGGGRGGMGGQAPEDMGEMPEGMEAPEDMGERPEGMPEDMNQRPSEGVSGRGGSTSTRGPNSQETTNT